MRLHLEGALVAGFGQKGFAWVWGIYGREFYAEGAVEVEMLAESFWSGRGLIRESARGRELAGVGKRTENAAFSFDG